MVLNRPSVAAGFEPTSYRRWFSRPLGRRVDADEKAVVFALAQLNPGERVLDLGCGDGNYTGPAAERTGRRWETRQVGESITADARSRR